MSQTTPAIALSPAGRAVATTAVAGIADEMAIIANNVDIYYGPFQAIRQVSLPVQRYQITSLIGPSGCGKSTFLRSLNRMNDLIPSARTEGSVIYRGVDIYGPAVDPVQVRRRIGVVFQKPNPFPKFISENVAWGARINRYSDNMDDVVER